MREKFGVEPVLIPDFLALVGDAADGYPGIAGIGPITAARLLNRHGIIEDFPPAVLGDSRDLALLFKDLATLRTDARLFRDVDELRWRGPTNAFAACAERLGDARLLQRCLKAQKITQMTNKQPHRCARPELPLPQFEIGQAVEQIQGHSILSLRVVENDSQGVSLP